VVNLNIERLAIADKTFTGKAASSITIIRCATPNILKISSSYVNTGPTDVFRTVLRKANFVNPSIARIKCVFFLALVTHGPKWSICIVCMGMSNFGIG
jgi:hypothetical protein